MNKFNHTFEKLQLNDEKERINEITEKDDKIKDKIINKKNNLLTKNTKNNEINIFLTNFELLPKFPNTTKTNNYFIKSFRTKYTSEQLKSIQISYDNSTNLNHNILNDSNENNNDNKLNNKNMICNSIGSGNIGKSIESIHLLNSNNNFIPTNKSEPNNIINFNEKEKENNEFKNLNSININQVEKNNKQEKKIKNHYILNPDYNCTYNFPFKQLSFDEEIKRNINKFNSFVQRKINFQKYSNLSLTPNRTTNKKNISIEQEKKANNNFISISDNIEESIHSQFTNYGKKLISDSDNSNKQLSNSLNPSQNKGIYKNSNNDKSNNNKESRLIFDTNNNISYVLDNIVGKIIKGKLFSWVVGDILYESGNSTIYKAFNINDGNIFVVKKYNCLDGVKCENYINEVKIYENLNHPNIIKYIFSEQINNHYFLYLEYIPGGSIKNMVDQFGGFNERLIRKYTKQILFGLKYLHDNKIIHRDIKCANLLIGDKGTIKLTDFGCSKKISLKLSKKDSSSNEEYCTSLKGTIPWCAPEVICHKKYGKKADIWSLGCTLIEMTGHQPWGNIDNIFQVMNKIGKTNLTPEIPDYLSNNFKEFLELCFIREPKKRANLKTLIKHKFITGFYI